MLTAFLWFRITAKLKGSNLKSVGFWLQFYIHRYIRYLSRFDLESITSLLRLTPVYLIIMGIDVLLSVHVSDGPFWRPIEKTYCQKTWYANTIDFPLCSVITV